MSGASNPPAFPLVATGDFQFAHDGMSLRDWFAGQALVGFLANTKRPTTLAPDDAAWCYTIADAMLLARESVA